MNTRVVVFGDDRYHESYYGKYTSCSFALAKSREPALPRHNPSLYCTYSPTNMSNAKPNSYKSSGIVALSASSAQGIED